MKTKIVNLTPHPIHIVDGENNVVRTFQPEGLVRLKALTVPCGDVDGIPLTFTKFGEPEGLPELKCFSPEELEEEFDNLVGGNVPSVHYIVSQLVKSALPDREDLLVPAEVVRDATGNIVGCKSLGF